MSRPRFLVVKLKDLRLPLIMVMIAVAAVAFFMYTKKPATETFAPSESYEDGLYIASLSLTDAYFDVVVSVEDRQITSIQLDNIDEMEMAIYPGLLASISFLNDYVTTTQSLELPAADSLSVSTMLLMDAVQVALSDDPNATLTTRYQNPTLTNLSTDLEMEDMSEEVNSDQVLEENVEEIGEEAAIIEELTILQN